MAETLIVFLDENKAKQNHVKAIIEKSNYKKVIVLSPFSVPNSFKDYQTINYDKNFDTSSLSNYFFSEIDIEDFEVDVNLICGEGKEHMALISALLKKGVGIRFVVITEKGVKEL